MENNDYFKNLYESFKLAGSSSLESDINSFNFEKSIENIKAKINAEGWEPRLTICGLANEEVEELTANGDEIANRRGVVLVRLLEAKLFQNDEFIFAYTNKGGHIFEGDLRKLPNHERLGNKEFIKRICISNIDNLAIASEELQKDEDFICDVIFTKDKDYDKEECVSRTKRYFQMITDYRKDKIKNVAFNKKFIDKVEQICPECLSRYVKDFKYADKAKILYIAELIYKHKEEVESLKSVRFSYSQIIGKLRKDVDFLFGLNEKYPGMIEGLPQELYFEYCTKHNKPIDIDAYNYTKATKTFVELYNKSLAEKINQDEDDSEKDL